MDPKAMETELMTAKVEIRALKLALKSSFSILAGGDEKKLRNFEAQVRVAKEQAFAQLAKEHPGFDFQSLPLRKAGA